MLDEAKSGLTRALAQEVRAGEEVTSVYAGLARSARPVWALSPLSLREV